MPRIIVETEGHDREVVFWEHVGSEDFDAEHFRRCLADRIGWAVERPKATMFAWVPIPEPYREMGSLAFSSFLVEEAKVATSPGVGFGPTGDGFVRFALIENEQRTGQAVRNLRRALTKL